MIKTEVLESGLIRTWSDKGYYIVQVETGIEYAEAIDVPNKYTYVESERKIEEDERDGE